MKSSHSRKRGSALHRLGESIAAFAQKKYGVPVLTGGAVALCVLLGLGAYTLVACAASPQGSAASASALGASSAVASSVVEDDQDYDAAANAIDTSMYSGTILPETEDAGEEYVDDTLFIGDSNSYRYMNYGFTTLANDIGVVSMGAGQIKTLPCVKFKSGSTAGSYITIPKAVAIMQPQRVVFGFGTNNLTGSVSSYIESYQKGIQACYDAYPYFDVIVCAIPPVDKNRDYPNVTMQQVDRFNAALVEMCEENGWKFLNTSEVLKDSSTGFAKTDYTISDGLHLSKAGCTALFDYIRTHAYLTEDRRPALKSVPERAETPPDLITSDPLKSNKTNSSASSTIPTVNVTFSCTAGGTLTGTLEQAVAEGGTCTTVTAVPDEGYVFAGWSCTVGRIDDVTQPSLNFVVPGAQQATGGVFVTAAFEEVEPTPSPSPSATPTATPSTAPTVTPAPQTTPQQTQTPTQAPTQEPTQEPTQAPTQEPTQAPTQEPTQAPAPEPTPESATPPPTNEVTEETQAPA